MISTLIDTNVYSYLFKGNDRIAQILDNSRDVFIPFIVIAELKAGFKRGTKEAINLQLLSNFTNRPSVKELFPNSETCIFYARIYAQVKSIGKSIPTNDIWIAALSLQHSASLLAYDKHFQFVDNLKLIK